MGIVIDVLPESQLWGTVYPQNQSLIYTFSSLGQQRTNQDVGFDGYDDAEESSVFGTDFGTDPSNDNYTYFLKYGR